MSGSLNQYEVENIPENMMRVVFLESSPFAISFGKIPPTLFIRKDKLEEIKLDYLHQQLVENIDPNINKDITRLIKEFHQYYDSHGSNVLMIDKDYDHWQIRKEDQDNE